MTLIVLQPIFHLISIVTVIIADEKNERYSSQWIGNADPRARLLMRSYRQCSSAFHPPDACYFGKDSPTAIGQE